MTFSQSFRDSHMTVDQKLIAVSLWHWNDVTLIRRIHLGHPGDARRLKNAFFCTFSLFVLVQIIKCRKNNFGRVAAATKRPTDFCFNQIQSLHQQNSISPPFCYFPSFHHCFQQFFEPNNPETSTAFTGHEPKCHTWLIFPPTKQTSSVGISGGLLLAVPLTLC